MPIYFFAAGIDTAKGNALESAIRRAIPQLEKIESVEELSLRLQERPSEGVERTFVLFPFSQADTSIDRLTEMATRGRQALYFIFISEDISANDYKRLVRAGNADWVSAHGAPQEVLDIVSRRQRPASSESTEQSKPAFAVFVPSAGGVGNSTLAIETAVQIKTNRATRSRAVCLVDLDFQTSHVCDLLDIEPRLEIAEISQNPQRLDTQLFDLFVSHHSTGLDVLAAARSKHSENSPHIAALDALFAMISRRYDLILVDLPLPWLGWTRQILSAADLAVVTGLNTIPSLRQSAETVRAIRELEYSPGRIVVALNRCETSLLGGVARRQFGKRILGDETVLLIRDHPSAAHHSVNTGVPVSLAAPSSRISKDIRKLASLVSSLPRLLPLAAAGQIPGSGVAGR